MVLDPDPHASNRPLEKSSENPYNACVSVVPNSNVPPIKFSIAQLIQAVTLSMNPENTKIESREIPEIGLRIEFSPQHDAEMVRDNLDPEEIEWNRTMGYPCRLPNKVEEAVSRGTIPTVEEIIEAVTAEYQSARYEQQSLVFTEAWNEQRDGFIKNLSTLGVPLPNEYILRLTRYGTGGMYKLPNEIEVIVNDPITTDFHTPFHEMVHLTIEDLIVEHHIGHWTKERLVDLILNMFVPEKKYLQQDPPHTKQIDQLFEQYFPDVKRIIEEITTLGRGA